MKLKCLSLYDLEDIRQWRNEQLESLRTSFLLTEEIQEQFYKDIICNRQSNSRFWGVWSQIDKDNETIPNPIYKQRYELIGMCGIENIQWENRLGEISLLLNPELLTNGNIQESLELVLHEGFNNLNLENIYAEVFTCNPYRNFWLNISNKYNLIRIPVLPNRKYYNGKYYSSWYININKESYLKHEN